MTLRAGEARVALLTNFIPPYRVPVLRALAARVRALEIFVSTPMESNRGWSPDWSGLQVRTQRTLTLPRIWKHPSGFRERIPIHLPLDTSSCLTSFRPDVVITGELGTRTVAAERWARGGARRVVAWATLSERTEAGRGMLRGWLRGRILRGVDAVIVNGESGARYIREFGYPEERIYRVAQASPVASRDDRPGRSADRIELVYVGQVVERKGLERFVGVLDRWCTERGVDVRLTVVGAGHGSTPAPREDSRLEVRPIGHVPFEGLGMWYGRADILAFPTLADEWGLVVNEAMASGLPVLGSVHSQAVTELVEEGRTGWRYDPERSGDLEAALDRMQGAGAGGIERMGAAARDAVAELTPERMGARLAHVIDDVLASDRRRP